MLIDGLPDDSRTHRIDPHAPPWGLLEELVAQVVEEVSIMTAQRAREEPVVVPRPYAAGEVDGPKKSVETDGATTTFNGVAGLLAAARTQGTDTVVFTDG